MKRFARALGEQMSLDMGSERNIEEIGSERKSEKGSRRKSKKRSGKKSKDGSASVKTSKEVYRRADGIGALFRSARQLTVDLFNCDNVYGAVNSKDQGSNSSYDCRTLIWYGGCDSWPVAASGITWAAVDGEDTICVVTKKNKHLNKACVRGSFRQQQEKHVLKDFMTTIANDMKVASSEITWVAVHAKDTICVVTRKDQHLDKASIRGFLCQQQKEPVLKDFLTTTAQWTEVASSGITWLAVHGEVTICVVTKQNQYLEQDKARIRGSFRQLQKEHIFKDTMTTIVPEMEGLSSELRRRLEQCVKIRSFAYKDGASSHTTLFGIVHSDFMILGADSLTTRSKTGAVVEEKLAKIKPLHRKVFMLISGDVQFGRSISEEVSDKLSQERSGQTPARAAHYVEKAIMKRIENGEEVRSVGYLVGGAYHPPGARKGHKAKCYGLYKIVKNDGENRCTVTKSKEIESEGTGSQYLSRAMEDIRSDKSRSELESIVFNGLEEAADFDWGTGGDTRMVIILNRYIPNDVMTRSRTPYEKGGLIAYQECDGTDDFALEIKRFQIQP